MTDAQDATGHWQLNVIERVEMHCKNKSSVFTKTVYVTTAKRDITYSNITNTHNDKQKITWKTNYLTQTRCAV